MEFLSGKMMTNDGILGRLRVFVVFIGFFKYE